MKRTIILLVLYLVYQLLFTFLVMLVNLLVNFGISASKGMATGATPAELLATLGTGDNLGNVTTIALGVILAAAAMMWTLYKHRYVYSDAAFLRQKGTWWILLVCIPFVYTTMYLLNVLCGLINLPNLLEDSFMDMSGNILGIFSIAIAAPVLEECLFRGAIEGHLLRTWKRPWLAVVVSALVFGLIHMNPAQMVFGFLAGLVLGWLYYRTGSILPGIVGHVLNNSIAVVNMRVCDNGVESMEEMLGETAQPYILAAYGVIFVVCAWFLYKKMHRSCNFSENPLV